METLELLGVALGLATLAGINLYLTVFAAGLAINMGWISLAPHYEKLAILGDPVIVALAGVLFFVEFFADKIPWVDSAWDTLHTVVRPLGGALLAVQVLGQSNPVFDVAIGLLAGSVTLGAHSIKAGTRLAVNASPEPFSNVALSVTEDVAVVGGLALTALNPVFMLAVVVFVLSLGLYLAPKVWRSMAMRSSLLFNRIARPRPAGVADALPAELSPNAHMAFKQARPEERTVSWALPAFVRRAPGLKSGFYGWLIGTREHPGVITFVPRTGIARHVQDFDVSGFDVALEDRLLSERLTLYAGNRKDRLVFVFHAHQGPQARRLRDILRRSLAGNSRTESPDELTVAASVSA